MIPNDVGKYRALLPELIRFSYIPANSLKVHDDSKISTKTRDAQSYDFSAFSAASGSNDDRSLDDSQVLVLDFTDGPRNKKPQGS